MKLLPKTCSYGLSSKTEPQVNLWAQTYNWKKYSGKIGKENSK